MYAKEPHALTHDVDSLRYFCVWWAAGPPAVHSAPRAHWEADVWEDYGKTRRRRARPTWWKNTAARFEAVGAKAPGNVKGVFCRR